MELKIRCDGDISLVEEAMNVPTQKQAVAGFVFTSFCVGSYMCGLEGGERPFAGDRAPAIVDVGYLTLNVPWPSRGLTRIGSP
jgi:hypothetical protein